MSEHRRTVFHGPPSAPVRRTAASSLGDGFQVVEAVDRDPVRIEHDALPGLFSLRLGHDGEWDAYDILLAAASAPDERLSDLDPERVKAAAREAIKAARAASTEKHALAMAATNEARKRLQEAERALEMSRRIDSDSNDALSRRATEARGEVDAIRARLRQIESTPTKGPPLTASLIGSPENERAKAARAKLDLATKAAEKREADRQAAAPFVSILDDVRALLEPEKGNPGTRGRQVQSILQRISTLLAKGAEPSMGDGVAEARKELEDARHAEMIAAARMRGGPGKVSADEVARQAEMTRLKAQIAQGEAELAAISSAIRSSQEVSARQTGDGFSTAVAKLRDVLHDRELEEERCSRIADRLEQLDAEGQAAWACQAIEAEKEEAVLAVLPKGLAGEGERIARGIHAWRAKGPEMPAAIDCLALDAESLALVLSMPDLLGAPVDVAVAARVEPKPKRKAWAYQLVKDERSVGDLI